jgi:hypothetical protein
MDAPVWNPGEHFKVDLPAGHGIAKMSKIPARSIIIRVIQ